MRKRTIAGLTVILLAICFYFYSCRNNDLRGWWKDSDDGKTYLVIEPAEGGPMNAQFTLDGRPWPHPAGKRVRSNLAAMTWVESGFALGKAPNIISTTGAPKGCKISTKFDNSC